MVDIVSSGLISLAIGLLVVAALHDAAVRTIPNCIPASLAVAGLVLRVQAGDAISSFGITALLLLILGGLWLRGYIGGGDVKLIPAVSLVLSPSDVVDFVLFVSVTGGVLALLYLVLSYLVRRPRPGPRRGLLARVLKAEAWRLHRRGPLPYAVAIAGGALPGLIKTLSG